MSSVLCGAEPEGVGAVLPDEGAPAGAALLHGPAALCAPQGVLLRGHHAQHPTQVRSTACPHLSTNLLFIALQLINDR